MYDEECLKLAQYFLRDAPHLRDCADELANEIQAAVEFWFFIKDAQNDTASQAQASDVHSAGAADQAGASGDGDLHESLPIVRGR